MELGKVKKIVIYCLEKFERCRESDTRLVATIWKHHIKPDLAKMTAEDLLQKLADNDLPSFESIGRMRRKLQEQRPELRGKNYVNRQQEEKKVIEELKTL